MRHRTDRDLDESKDWEFDVVARGGLDMAEIFKDCHPSLQPAESPAVVFGDKCRDSEARAIRAALDKAGYSHDALTPIPKRAIDFFEGLLKADVVADTAKLAAALEKAQRHLADEVSDLGTISRYFAFGIPASEEKLWGALGENAMKSLLSCGLVARCAKHPSIVASFVMLYPVPYTKLILATDWSPYHLNGMHEQMVYAIGGDSLGLVHNAPPMTGKLVIDVCAGSGVQGLTAVERGASSVTLVDRNPRAVRFARFNANLNGRGDQVKVVQFELGQEVASSNFSDARYDFLLANPPFVPTPAANTDPKWYSSGGGSGEDVLTKILVFAKHVLKESGELAIVTELPNPKNFGVHLRRDLGFDGFSGTVVYGSEEAATAYAANRASAKWSYSMQLKNLQVNKIRSMARGFIFARRSATSSSFAVKSMDNPWTPPSPGETVDKRPCHLSGLDDPVDGDGCAELLWPLKVVSAKVHDAPKL